MPSKFQKPIYCDISIHERAQVLAKLKGVTLIEFTESALLEKLEKETVIENPEYIIFNNIKSI
jgi:hypothetical protein